MLSPWFGQLVIHLPFNLGQPDSNLVMAFELVSLATILVPLGWDYLRPIFETRSAHIVDFIQCPTNSLSQSWLGHWTKGMSRLVKNHRKNPHVQEVVKAYLEKYRHNRQVQSRLQRPAFKSLSDFNDTIHPSGSFNRPQNSQPTVEEFSANEAEEESEAESEVRSQEDMIGPSNAHSDSRPVDRVDSEIQTEPSIEHPRRGNRTGEVGHEGGAEGGGEVGNGIPS